MNTIKPQKWSFNSLLFLAIGIFFLLIASLSWMIWQGSYQQAFTIFLIYVPVLALYAYLIYEMKAVYRLKGLHVFEDHLELEHSHTTKKINFKDILELKIIGKQRGNYKIVSQHLSLKINVQSFEFKKLSLLTEAIYKARPDLLSPDNFSEIRTQHLYFKDDNYKYEGVIHFIPFVFIFAIYLLQLKVYALPDFLIFFGSAAIVFAVVPFTALCAIELGFMKKWKKEFANKVKQGSWGEFDIKAIKLRKMKLAAILYALTLPYFVFVYKYDLNLIDYKENHWVDERYGQSLEKFKLEKDDHIFFSWDYDGVIVAVPGESVAINVQKGRKLANEELVQVPEDQFGVRSGTSVLLVKKHLVYGKVIEGLDDFFSNKY